MNFIFAFFSWIWGLLLVIAGVAMFSQGSVFLASLIVLCGLMIIPPIKHRVFPPKTRWKVSSVSSILALFFIGWIGSDVAENQTAQAQTQPSQPTQLTNQSAKIAEIPTGQPVNAPTPAPAPVTPPPPEPIKYDIECKVVGVADGDTLTCLKNKTQIKVRLDQIDAPEKNQDYGSVSKKFLSDMVYGQVVGLKTKEKDKYGRTVAEVHLGQKNVNKSMVRVGMAWAYKEYVKDNEYITLEEQARNNKMGLWSQPNPIYPSQFRQEQRQKQEQEKAMKAEQRAKEAPQPHKKQSGGGGYSCGSKRYCKEMSNCAEARHYLNVCGLSRLDRDGDGVPCESICR